MDNYLYKHYKGKYRVLADYDYDTKDFPRNEQGNIDEDFADFYIPGRKNIQIRHGERDNLGCYIFNRTLAKNILIAIYEKELNKTAPKKIETVATKLLNENIITEFTDYDGEFMFMFKSHWLDDWCDIFKLKKSGANISPLSPKNLPKSEYVIDKDDEMVYNELFNNLTKTQKMQIAKKAVNNVAEKLTKKQKVEMKTLCMKPKQYIHYVGKWNKLIDEVRKLIKENNYE